MRALKRRRALVWFSVGLVAALVLDLTLSIAYYQHARRHYAAKPQVLVDAVIVLYSGHSPDGSLNAETRRRLAWASAIYKADRAGAIICSGGAAGERGAGSVRMRDYLIAVGVPPARVTAETQSFDTITNVRRSHAIAREQRWHRLAIVSSPVHVARAVRLARRQGMEVVAAGYDPATADPPVRHLEALAQVHHEWLAAIAGLLPESAYLGLLQWWRNAPPGSRPARSPTAQFTR